MMGEIVFAYKLFFNFNIFARAVSCPPSPPAPHTCYPHNIHKITKNLKKQVENVGSQCLKSQDDLKFVTSGKNMRTDRVELAMSDLLPALYIQFWMGESLHSFECC